MKNQGVFFVSCDVYFCLGSYINIFYFSYISPSLLSLCMCFICAPMYVGICTCTIPAESKKGCQLFFSLTLRIIPLKYCLSFNLELVWQPEGPEYFPSLLSTFQDTRMHLACECFRSQCSYPASHHLVPKYTVFSLICCPGLSIHSKTNNCMPGS